MNKFILFDKNTDADATNRGFLYQYLITLKNWVIKYIENTDFAIYCEYEEDIMNINDSVNEKAIIFEQIKCYTKNFSINSDEIRKSLFNFLILYLKYHKKVSTYFIFRTNTYFIKNSKILKYWIESQTNINIENHSKLVTLIRDEMIKIVKEESNKRIASIEKQIEKSKTKNADNKYTEAIQNYSSLISEYLKAEAEIIEYMGNNNNNNDFINRVTFEFGNENTTIAVQKAKNEIMELLKGIDSIEHAINIVFSRLLTEIYFKSSTVEVEGRKLTRKLFEEIINETKEEMLNKSHPKLQNIVAELARHGEQLNQITGLSNDILNKVEELLKYTHYSDLTIEDKSKYILPVFNDDEINKKKDCDDTQSKLVSKIKLIELDSEDEELWIEVATQIRCRYLLYLEELKVSNLYESFKDIKGLESKVKRICLQEVRKFELNKEISPTAFWTILEEKLKQEARNHALLNNYELDEEIVYAQMYQMAAECYLRWHKKGGI